MLVKFVVGKTYLHDWYEGSDGSRVFQYVGSWGHDPGIGHFSDATGAAVKLRLDNMQPFTEATPPPETLRGRFLVWSPKGPRNPSYAHPTATDAGLEARRLANKTGQDFYVVEIKEGYRQPIAVRPPLQEI